MSEQASYDDIMSWLAEAKEEMEKKDIPTDRREVYLPEDIDYDYFFGETND